MSFPALPSIIRGINPASAASLKFGRQATTIDYGRHRGASLHNSHKLTINFQYFKRPRYSRSLTTMSATHATPVRRLNKPALFICDIQEKFRPAIWEYEKIILTTKKMLRAAQILAIPIFATTQNAARLGDTCAELDISPAVELADKSAFSMWVPAISKHFDSSNPSEIVIVGIESHICVTQTTIDALAAGHKVYVLADGVGSCNKEEVPIALDRLRALGAVVTTSESWLYECMGDAAIPEFKQIAALVKEYSKDTKLVMQTLLGKL